MPMPQFIQTPVVNESLRNGETVYALECATRSLDALNWMLNQTLSASDGDAGLLSEHAMGLFDLIATQTGIITAAREQVETLLDEKRDLMLMLGREVEEPEAHAAEVHELRAAIIREKMDAGIKMATIGRALGLSNEAVERAAQPKRRKA